MIQDTDLVFRDPYLDHNNSQALRVHVFLNSISVYIDMLHFICSTFTTLDANTQDGVNHQLHASHRFIAPC